MGVDEIRAAYEKLLDDNGLRRPGRPSAEFIQKLHDGYQEAWRAEGKTEDEIRELTAELFADQSTGMVRTIENLSTEVETDLKSLGATIDVPVFVGEYPTGELNAQIRKVGDGCLILVNTGLLMTIHLIMKAAVRSLKYEREAGNVLRIRTVLADSVPHVIEELLEIIAAYDAWDVTRASWRGVVTGDPQIMLSRTVWSAEKFVVAHEYAHLMRGDVGPATAMLENSAGKIRVVIPDHQKELDTDIMAVSIIMASANWAQDEMDAKFLLAGPFIFFGICEMLDRLGEVLYRREARYSLTHPPTPDRIEHLRAYVFKKYGESMLSAANLFLRWLEGHTALIVEHFQEGLIEFPEGSPNRVNP